MRRDHYQQPNVSLHETLMDLRSTARLTHSTIFNRYSVTFRIGMVESL